MPKVRVGKSYAIVDECDLPKVRSYRWYMMRRSDRDMVYAQADHKGRKLLMHRVVLDMKPNDHRRVIPLNGNGLDCRRSNLSIGHGERDFIGESGLKGVTENKRNGKWIAQINHGGKQHYLGIFDTSEEAHKEYIKAKERLTGHKQRKRPTK